MFDNKDNFLCHNPAMYMLKNIRTTSPDKLSMFKKIRKKEVLDFLSQKETNEFYFNLKSISWLSLSLITISTIHRTITIGLKRHLGVFSAF